MTDMARLLLLLGLAGTAVTFLGSASLWFFNEPRRIRRALRRVMKTEPEAIIVAQGRGRGAGFSTSANLAAVAWDKGAWCLVYRLEEILGAELIIDGHVIARVYRGEQRRPLDQTVASADQITLRLIMSDPSYPDFELDLWLTGDENRRDDWSPRAATQEGNRWLARIDAIVRRPLPPRAAPHAAAVEATPVVAPPPPPPPQPPPAPAPRPAPAPAPIAAPVREPERVEVVALDDEDDDPPWDVDEGRLF